MKKIILFIFLIILISVSSAITNKNNYSFSKDTWYYLEADVYDNHFRIKLNYEEMIVADDNTFSEGSVGFWVFNNPGHHTSVDFDDFDICR